MPDFKKCIQFVLAAQEKCKQVDKCHTFIIKFVMKIVNLDMAKKKEEKQQKENTPKINEVEEEEDEEPNHPLIRAVFFFLFGVSHTVTPDIS